MGVCEMVGLEVAAPGGDRRCCLRSDSVARVGPSHVMPLYTWCHHMCNAIAHVVPLHVMPSHT